MNHIGFLSGCLAIFTLISAQNASGAPSPGSQPRGELLVKWKDGTESLAAAASNQALGAEVARNFPNVGWQHIILPLGMTVGEGVATYRTLDGVLAVETSDTALRTAQPRGTPSLASGDSEPVAELAPDGLTSPPRGARSLLTPTTVPPLTPNDPRFGSQWNLKKISAPQAWAVTTGSSNVVVAVVDTGVNYRHPDLAANMWVNPGETGLDANGHDKATNGIDDDGNGYVDDVHGINTAKHSGDPMDFGYDFGSGPFFHGSAMAGVIGAVGNNGTGIAGINWNVRLMAVAIPNGTVPQFLEAVDYILGMKKRGVNVRVISNSLFTENRHPLNDVIDTAGHEEILTVLDASNNGYNNDVWSFDSPNSFWWISVAGSDQSDALVSYSDYGRSTVDFAAPTSVPATINGSGYVTDFSGDSAAQPHGAGAAALLAAAKPDATALEIKAALRHGVDQLPAFKNKTVTGGRLNIAAALQALTNADLPPIVVGALPVANQVQPGESIAIAFSHSMDRASVEAAFQITPNVSGTFQWTNDDRMFHYLHTDPLKTDLLTTNYICRILGTAHDLAGRTLDGNFNRTAQGSPADDFVWTFSLPLANDNFADAKAISGDTGTAAGTTRYATVELTEPLFSSSRTWGLSVWYRWTADTAAWTTFDLTLSNTFDTVLGVFTGSQLDQLSTNIFNDNYGLLRGSRVSFPAALGTNYFIKVAAKWPGNVVESMWGDFLLRWYPTPTPAFTGSEFSPTNGLMGTSVSLTGTDFTGATAVLFNGTNASFTNAVFNYMDLQLNAVVPINATAGPITVVTPHGTVTSSNSFVVLQPDVPPRLTARVVNVGLVELTWPEGTVDYGLEATEHLGDSAHWQAVSGPLFLTDPHVQRVLTDGTTRYFRLRKP